MYEEAGCNTFVFAEYGHILGHAAQVTESFKTLVPLLCRLVWQPNEYCTLHSFLHSVQHFTLQFCVAFPRVIADVVPSLSYMEL